MIGMRRSSSRTTFTVSFLSSGFREVYWESSTLPFFLAISNSFNEAIMSRWRISSISRDSALGRWFKKTTNK